MKDLMVDIEALGTSNNGLVCQIGACYFDRYTGAIESETFLQNISIDDALRHGLTVDGGALKFWLETHKPSFLKGAVELEKALAWFRNYAKEADQVWSHATFDMILLGSAYQSIGQGHAIPYRNMRDIRTLVDLARLPYNKPDKPKTHNALDDCIYQVQYCVQCFNKIKGEQNA